MYILENGRCFERDVTEGMTESKALASDILNVSRDMDIRDPLDERGEFQTLDNEKRSVVHKLLVTQDQWRRNTTLRKGSRRDMPYRLWK